MDYFIGFSMSKLVGTKHFYWTHQNILIQFNLSVTDFNLKFLLLSENPEKIQTVTEHVLRKKIQSVALHVIPCNMDHVELHTGYVGQVWHVSDQIIWKWLP